MHALALVAAARHHHSRVARGTALLIMVIAAVLVRLEENRVGDRLVALGTALDRGAVAAAQVELLKKAVRHVLS